MANADDRSAPDVNTFFFFFGGGWCDVKKPWTTQSLSSRAGSGRRRSPAEPQLGEFHSGGGGELIRRHVRKIREGKQALCKHGSANANANVLPGGVANALEGTLGPICFSAVTVDEGFGSDASLNCVTLLQNPGLGLGNSSTRWTTVASVESSVENVKCATLLTPVFFETVTLAARLQPP